MLRLPSAVWINMAVPQVDLATSVNSTERRVVSGQQAPKSSAHMLDPRRRKRWMAKSGVTSGGASEA
jgi:hypothetical protein